MIDSSVLHTERLVLIPATPSLLRAELSGADALAATIGARVPPGWPPELYDEAAIRWVLDQLIARPEDANWSFYYIVLPEPPGAGRVLVGLGGFKGAPGDDGSVEIGYSVVAMYQQRGFATEAVRALLRFAFADTRVRRVLAETYPHLLPSIGVLRKCGFEYIGEGSEEGVIRYAIDRATRSDPA